MIPDHAVDDLKAGNKQFAGMAIYWGAAASAMRTQVDALCKDRESRGIIEMIEVCNEDMDRMHKFYVTGIPTMFSRYSFGVVKYYPFPEDEQAASQK
jgi:hypothetical protein